jgi:hypothetical protein
MLDSLERCNFRCFLGVQVIPSLPAPPHPIGNETFSLRATKTAIKPRSTTGSKPGELTSTKSTVHSAFNFTHIVLCSPLGIRKDCVSFDYYSEFLSIIALHKTKEKKSGSQSPIVKKHKRTLLGDGSKLPYHMPS